MYVFRENTYVFPKKDVRVFEGKINKKTVFPSV